MIKMRFNLRIKKFGHTLFVMFSETQTLEGITSLQKDGKHIILFDLDGFALQEVEDILLRVQVSYSLSDIFITSDRNRSFRAWCFSRVDFYTFLEILIYVVKRGYLDYNFFWWTVNKSKATLRTNNKKDRPPQKVVSVLRSYSVPIPASVEMVTYDTGVKKRGLTVFLGEKGKVILGDNRNG